MSLKDDSKRVDSMVETLDYIFSCGSAGEESTCNVGDLGSISGLGRSLEKGISAASFVNHC